MKILLYNPDNGVTRNFMPHLWMFLLQSPTRVLYLKPHADYILKMPRTPVRAGIGGGLWIHGGHNIVIIGGEFDFNGVVNTNPTKEKEGRVITLMDVTGVVHIEGIWAHGDGLL